MKRQGSKANSLRAIDGSISSGRSEAGRDAPEQTSTGHITRPWIVTGATPATIGPSDGCTANAYCVGFREFGWLSVAVF